MSELNLDGTVISVEKDKNEKIFAPRKHLREVEKEAHKIQAAKFMTAGKTNEVL